MSKGILINTLDTYIGTALYEEFLGENPEESQYEIYGTWHSKDDSFKPAHVKKMMKRSKPVLFRKYMRERMDCYIYDLHSGRLDDLKWAVNALTNEPLDSEKTLIVISSVLSWGGNPHYMVEDKPEPVEGEGEEGVNAEEGNNAIAEKPLEEEAGEKEQQGENEKRGDENENENEEYEEGEEEEENADERDQENQNIADNNQNEEQKNIGGENKEIATPKDNEGNNDAPGDGEEQQTKKKKRRRKKKVIPKVYKRIGYSEEEYEKRIPFEFYTKFKKYEDYLLNLKFENLNVYIVCAGIPYGNCETVFNYFFKSAWLQSPSQLPYYNDGVNLIPTIHVKDLAKIVKKICESKAEMHYIFATDLTLDKSLKNIISSISINVGNGKTASMEYDQNSIMSIALTPDDVFIDQKNYEKNKLFMHFTNHELTWTRYLGVDIMLKPPKFIEEEFEWWCKEGIPGNTGKLLKEFCSYRKLRPLTIVMNCKDIVIRRKFAEKLSRFYNIPVLNYDLIMEKLNQNIDTLTQEEVFMNQKYFALKNRIQFLEENPDYKNEANELLFNRDEILYECLKYLLHENDALNRGYVLEGIPVNEEEVTSLYYYKKEIVPEEGEEQNPEEEEEIEDEGEADMTEKKGENIDIEEHQDKENEGENENKQENIPQKEEEENEEEHLPNEEDKKEENEKKDGEEEQQHDNDVNPGNENVPTEEPKKKKKKKKIRPKKYQLLFNKNLLPESVITICSLDKKTREVDNDFLEVERFYQDNKIEILNLVYEQQGSEDPEEIFEIMRIYIERNGRPFNYFNLTDDDINKNRIHYVDEKVEQAQNRIQAQKIIESNIEKEKEEKYWTKMSERLEKIKKDKEELDLSQSDKVPTRKFLLLNIMPILTKGMLEVCKINPIDPIDYLADFLFTNSTDS